MKRPIMSKEEVDELEKWLEDIRREQEAAEKRRKLEIWRAIEEGVCGKGKK